MIEKVFIISFLVFAINYTLQDGEIFGSVGEWLYKHLPYAIHDPAFDCVVCMVPWYGSALYWLIWATAWQEWIVVVIAAMGLNAVIVKLSPPKDDGGDDPEEIKMYYGR